MRLCFARRLVTIPCHKSFRGATRAVVDQASNPLSKTPEPQARMSVEPLIAVFVDFENLAIGVRDMGVGTFQIQLVLKRLLEKGRIVYKRAYCDWTHYKDELQEFHGQGIELIDIPQRRMTGKNSADIRWSSTPWTCVTRKTTSTFSRCCRGTATFRRSSRSSRRTTSASSAAA